MRKFSRTLLASGLCAFVAVGLQAEPSPQNTGLESLMTPEQYRQAGLHKLNEQERAALYQWLRDHRGDIPVASVEAPVNEVAPEAAAVAPAVAVTPVAASTDAAPAPASETAVAAGNEASAATVEEHFGLPEPPQEAPEDRFQLHASVKEPFKGWSGKTVFYLDNGQVWRQRASGRYTYMGEDNRVVISKNSWGFYELRLVDADRSIGVKRVR